MRVFFVGTGPIQGAGVAPDSMEAHVVSGLTGLGAQCEYFPFLTAVLGSRLNRWMAFLKTDLGLVSRTVAERSLVSRVRSFDPDLVLTLLGNYTPPETIELVREATDAPVVCWCQDHMGQLGRQELIGARYDHVFAKDATMIELFRRYTKIPDLHYLPEACNPRVHRPVQLTEEERKKFSCDVATAATLYYFRSDVLESLVESDDTIDLRVWGTLPRHYRGPLRSRHMGSAVFMRDKAACFTGAKIVINTLHPMESGGLNARAFEVAGCGGFQLVSSSAAVSRHFEPGKEIETFYDLGELKDKTRYYLAHETERRAIAEAGRRRAHAEHTYERRLQTMLQAVFPSWQPVAASALAA